MLNINILFKAGQEVFKHDPVPGEKEEAYQRSFQSPLNYQTLTICERLVQGHTLIVNPIALAALQMYTTCTLATNSTQVEQRSTRTCVLQHSFATHLNWLIDKDLETLSSVHFTNTLQDTKQPFIQEH